ncbi:aminoglycoside phosphotransferase family protein [Microbacterium aoyamense]|uniref:Aminoglycoside phosphotransferase family protein n=1 Tax=Microbacterium aoyamense TaxID=344166 RepID=A0ABN2P8S2_9MICO|nr:aminoglycoside phosphotransferase family protein [Microbacterium aoyamense]
MPDKPPAEVLIDERVVRALLAQANASIPDAASRALTKTSEGWDSEVWRLGEDLAVRLPRRALAAPLVLHEQRALPVVGPRIEATGIHVPIPVFAGSPSDHYPWHWSIVPWYAGTAGLHVPRAERADWAGPLAAALVALHAPAPADHPVNPVRGVPLTDRAPLVSERVALLRETHALPPSSVDALESVWRAGLAAAPWSADPVWIHGDLHPGNLVADGGRLVALIDFGDVTAGDPAYDLAVAWLAFDARGRARFRSALEGRHDAATWVRARAWAATIAMMLVINSDDNPDYGALGAEAIPEVLGD